MKPPELHQITIKKGGKKTHIQVDRIAYITEEVAYWRKANAIHRWFVENVQDGEDDCKEYYVDRSKLEELLDEVTQALIHKKDASEILPTQAGFFFGSEEYDEYYFQDLEETKKILTELLKEPTGEWGSDFYYQSSW